MRKHRTIAICLAVLLAGIGTQTLAAAREKLEGYLDYKKQPYLIVDGQRLQVTKGTKVEAGKNRGAFDIPAGYSVKVTGSRRRDGTIKAKKIEAAPNGTEFMEGQVMSATNEEEKKYLAQRAVYDTDEEGRRQLVGRLITSGPDVERCRRIVERLVPPYVDPERVRVYVVDNKAWNAMAMANYSVYVFSGLLPDMDDDELAIVLGHELAHATYEHSRRQARSGLFGSIAGVTAAIASQRIGSDRGRAIAQGATILGVTTVGNVYSRSYEDQADRVGLRYVYEAGYDVRKAPVLWKRFAEKYGDGSRVTNFFFGNHSLARERAKALQTEIARNYGNQAVDPPSAEAVAQRW